MSIDKLKLNNLPTVPGVYQFFDKFGGILYIGKAKNLRSRVKSYFLPSSNLVESRSFAISEMAKQVEKTKTYPTDSEIEALILEAGLINRIKPKYNSMQKDDKSFSLIAISKDEIPRVEIVRSRNVNIKDKNFQYFGPFPSGDILKRALRILRKIFPFANCRPTKFSRQEKIGKVCLFGDIDLCLGQCQHQSKIKESIKQIKYLRDFLAGKKGKVIKNLKIEMEKLSSMKKYEDAAKVRDKIFALEHLNRYSVGIKDSFVDFQLAAVFPRIEAYDISNIGGDFAVGAMTVIEVGKIAKDEYKKFKIKTVESSNDIAMMIEVISRRLKNSWPRPNLIVIDGGVGHLNATIKLFKSQNIEIPILSIAKGPKRDKDEFHLGSSNLAKIFQKNPELKNLAIIVRDEAHRFSQSYYRKLHRKKLVPDR
ncbi:MAG: GIY-YIG nuclease family protein [Candidatus Berkelbacteria bacterium]|nr:GIY-YIG nuclease family protein [Candidatus Berkelbacteria bacterium]